MNTLVLTVFQGLLFLMLAPLLSTYIKKIKAFFQSRQGPPILQGYYDILKLMRKDSVASEHSSWIFRSAPFIGFSAMFTASFMVPLFVPWAPMGFAGDFLLLIYLFALVRFFTALSGLDTGSSFGGLGSSREMTLASLVEPAMVLAIFTVAVEAASVNLTEMVKALSYMGYDALTPGHVLATASFFIILLAETGRLPIDNPATHLELTMVHEAMVLENSGRNLAFIELGASLKQLILFVILSNVFLPLGMAQGLNAISALMSVGVLLMKLIVLGFAVAVVETTTAKYRLFRVPDLLTVSFVLSFLALLSHFMTGGG